jgi:hypothetical protein
VGRDATRRARVNTSGATFLFLTRQCHQRMLAAAGVLLDMSSRARARSAL